MDIKKNRPVAIWLFMGAGMIVIQVLLGGITRLTGSGLSITEWKPILGALPPMNEQDWSTAFEKYKQIAQYKLIHNYFTLHDFKLIYFWEWLHRNWARFMGVAFIVPFAYFIYKKRIDRTMFWPMVVLFMLGALQGLVGWVMVASGVGTDLVYVSHIRLSAHFIAALLLLVYVIWFALKISVPDFKKENIPSVKYFLLLLLVVMVIQLTYGAFMAGTHAAKSAITWPSINGKYFLDLTSDGSVFHSLLSIQFIHRGVAYLLAIMVILFTAVLHKQPQMGVLYKMRNVPLAITMLQIVLGVLTLVQYLTPYKLWWAITHQLVGILLLVCFVILYFYSAKAKR